MPAEPVLALERLYDAVVARFAAEGPYNVAQPFGWRFVAQQHMGPRIVWVPGSPVGQIGRVGPPRNPGGIPRSLGTLYENFYVIISSQDPEAPENERLQYRITRLLHDYWYRAVYHAAHGTYELQLEEWQTDKLERRFGTALLVVGTIQAALLDVAPGDELGGGVAPADTAAVIDDSLLDVTETINVAPDDAP